MSAEIALMPPWAYGSTVRVHGRHVERDHQESATSQQNLTTPLFDGAMDMQGRVEKVFEDHKAAWLKAGIELGDLRWGFAMHHSRAMRIPQPDQGKGGFTGAMVPLGDMANHDSASMATWRVGAAVTASAPKRRRLLDDEGEGEQAAPNTGSCAVLEMMAGTDLPMGAPVTIPYGAKDNTAFLLRFGFNDGQGRHRSAVQVTAVGQEYEFVDAHPPFTPPLQQGAIMWPLQDKGGPWTAVATSLLSGHEGAKRTVQLHPSLPTTAPLFLLTVLHAAVSEKQAALAGSPVTAVTVQVEAAKTRVSLGTAGDEVVWEGPGRHHWHQMARLSLMNLAMECCVPKLSTPAHLVGPLNTWMQHRRAALIAAADLLDPAA